MMSVSVSHVYTTVFVRTYTITFPVAALKVGLARDAKVSSVIATLVCARMVLHATMYSMTTSVSECFTGNRKLANILNNLTMFTNLIGAPRKHVTHVLCFHKAF